MEKTKKGLGLFALVSILAVCIVLLVAFCAPASAATNGCPSETKYHGTIDGGIYFKQSDGGAGFCDAKEMTVTFDNVPAGIKIARVYTGVWQGSPGKGGKFTIKVGNHRDTYTACDPCPRDYSPNCDPWQCERCNVVNEPECHDYLTGCGVHFISYDATSYINAGSNTVTVSTTKAPGCTEWDGRVYLIALLVVYEDASMPKMTYWINEGSPYLNVGSACSGDADEIFIYFNGATGSTNALKYWTLGFPHVANAPTMQLNGKNIGNPDYVESYDAGVYEVFFRWDNIPSTYLNPSSNLFYYYDPAGYFERVGAAVLMLENVSTPPSYGVTATIDEASQQVKPGESTTYTIRVKNTGDLEASYSVVMSGTAIDEGTIDVSPLDWNTGTLAPNAENVQTVMVSTTSSTPETTYTLTATATCDQKTTVTDSATSELVVSSAEYTDDKANADIPVKGTVSGSYLDTQTSNDMYESIEEIESGGKPANRYSLLEHKWTFDVTGGSEVTFYLEAYRADSGESDDFEFAYSTDDSNYINMETCKVTKTADDNTYQTYVMPNTISGIVYIRVQDTDRTAGKKALDTIYIDNMFIRSSGSPPSNKMHIASIDMSLKTTGPNTNAIALVTIVDATGIAVQGATVSGRWSGATSDTDSGVTDASGQVSLSSDKVKNPPSGTTFTFTVDDVVLTGWTYDKAANIETSDSINVS